MAKQTEKAPDAWWSPEPYNSIARVVNEIRAQQAIDLPIRIISSAPLRPKVKQNDAPLALERPAIDAKEPKLF